MRRLVGNFEVRRNRLFGLSTIRSVVDELPNEFLPVARHPVNQCFWEEAGSLGKPELHMGPASVVHPPQECLIFLRSKAVVKCRTQGRNHRSAGVPAGCREGVSPARVFSPRAVGEYSIGLLL